MHFIGRSMVCIIGLACAISGCSQSTELPGAPSPPPPPSSNPPNAAPNVTSVFPAVGSASGGASITIVGTGFSPGMVAIFDGIRVTGRFDSRDPSFTTFYTEAPAHAVGAVDLVVSNPDGQSHRLPTGYTYAAPDSFDPNGDWGGYSLNGTDTWVEFVVREKRVVSASCSFNSRVDLIFAELPNVERGEFSVIADGGATFSGRIVSATEMTGTISIPACYPARLTWRADRKSD